MAGRNRTCCCGGVGIDCSFCDSNTTPARVKLEFSGLVICPTASDCIRDCVPTIRRYKYSEMVAAFDPNLTIEIDQSTACNYNDNNTDAFSIDDYTSSSCTTVSSTDSFRIFTSFSWQAGIMIAQLIYRHDDAGSHGFMFFYGELSTATPFDCIDHLPRTLNNSLPAGATNCDDCTTAANARFITDDSLGTCVVTAA